MLGRAQLEATRVGAIVVALEQEEITLDEFAEVIRSLTAESVQVIGCLLRNWADWSNDDGRRECARDVCSQLASRSRVLS